MLSDMHGRNRFVLDGLHTNMLGESVQLTATGSHAHIEFIIVNWSTLETRQYTCQMDISEFMLFEHVHPFTCH